ncbi:HipA domain-containing protein [Parendozoicomonas sp. Alg238-R29]|uniref:type II toxin-antitoxin system HipA family toxin n=1 Tax=Parendozoicomonas sp. Alg238-R29 TaxID=2993446 RepID=UPI00248EC3E4|nr:HipA domain-containing protein [Parendozoicomonas sp. Alg238-R29]
MLKYESDKWESETTTNYVARWYLFDAIALDIQLPDEPTAYAIRRFDRDGDDRVHTEDFAQIFELYAHNKYGKANSEQIALALYRFSDNGLADVQQMARRLLANILLANGDAHLKNWTVMYADKKHPTLSPAYDIVSTLPYVNSETGIALNIGREKAWYNIDMNTFETWARRADIPWQAIKVHIKDAMEQARSTWPELIKDLPMHEQHKAVMAEHMNNVTQAFRVTL